MNNILHMSTNDKITQNLHDTFIILTIPEESKYIALNHHKVLLRNIPSKLEGKNINTEFELLIEQLVSTILKRN